MQEIFQACCRITDMCAGYLGMSYGEFNVWAFLYVQPLIIFMSYLTILCVSKKWYAKTYSFVGIICSISYMIYNWLKFPISNDGFYRAVDMLNNIASTCGTTYEIVNLVIYVVLFMMIISFNSLITLRQRKKCLKSEAWYRGYWWNSNHNK